MRVDLCGVRGSTPAPGAAFVRYGGHTSCVALGLDGGSPSLILDAGTGVRNVSALLDGAPFRGSILLSHLHWDHVHGLPFFGAGDRDDAEVSLLLPEGRSGASAEEVLAAGMSPPHFPIAPGGLRGNWRFGSLEPGGFDAGGFSVQCRELPHKGGRTYGYRVSDGRSVLAYLPDHCPTSLGEGPDGLGEYHEAALALAADADVLVHDAHLLAAELTEQASFGHAAAEYAAELAALAGARRVVLFHHHPARTDEALDRIGRSFDRAGLSVEVGAEGRVLELGRSSGQ